MAKYGKELARLLHQELLVRYNDFLAPEVASIRHIYTVLHDKESNNSDFVGKAKCTTQTLLEQLTFDRENGTTVMETSYEIYLKQLSI